MNKQRPKPTYSLKGTILDALRNGPVGYGDLIVQLAPLSRADDAEQSIRGCINNLRRAGQIRMRNDRKLELVS